MGSLPSGLAAASDSSQSTIELRGGDRLILLTEGVPEARNEDGELLGFPRVESLLNDGADAAGVAAAAQSYGQNDDITVIGIARR